MADVFQKLPRRPGTTDYGKLYEQKMSALIGVKCALNEDIEDMWMATNVDGLGAFDDLVLFIQHKEIDNNKNREMYLIQMKHKKYGTIKLSWGQNDLLKYQESYFQIKEAFSNRTSRLQTFCQFEDVKFLIFTNTKVDTGSLIISSYESRNDVINTGETLKASNSSSTTYNSNFLNQMLIYQSQVKVLSIENQIKEEINKYFKNCNIQDDIIKCFIDWHLELIEDKGELRKKYIQSILLEHILSQYIPVPMATPFAKIDIWNEITEKFKYICFTNEDHLPKIWHAVQLKFKNIFDNQNIDMLPWHEDASLESSSIKEISKSCEYLFVRKMKYCYTKKELYLYLWQLCEVPLILNTNSDSFENISTALLKLDSWSKRSYIFIGQNSDHFPQTSLFSNMLDIEDNLREKVLNNIDISLQGKKAISLNKFKLTKAVLKTVTPDSLMDLFETQPISQMNEVEFYVSRFIRKPLLTINVLREQDAVFVVLINDTEHESYFTKLSPYGVPVPFKLYKLLEPDFSKNVICKIIIIKELDGLRDYRNIETVVSKVKQCEHFAIHYVRYINNEQLEWLYSNKNVNQIRPYILRSNLLQPDSELFNNVAFNVISDIAGEGKSTLLNFLANHCCNDIWVIKLNARDISDYIDKGDFSELKKFLFNHSHRSRCNNFFWKLFNCLYEDFKILLIVDGIDETEFNIKTETFFNTIKFLGIKTILATRPTLQKYLEEKYNTFSLSLEPLTDVERQSFVEHVLRKYNTNQKIYMSDILEKIFLWDNIVGAPLLLSLFETLLTDPKNIQVLSDIDVTDLFDLHINDRLERVNSFSRFTLRTLSRTALFVFYKRSSLSELFNMSEFNEDIEERLPIFIESKLVEKCDVSDIPVFAHRSLAEFLVAKYLTTLTDNPSHVLYKILKSLFYKEHERIRLFFDKIVLKNSPLLKIINDDKMERLILEKDLVDKFQRNCLHIAASYGRRFELRTKDSIWSGVKMLEAYNEKQDTHIVKLSQITYETKILVTGDFIDDLLKQEFDPFRKDGLFKMDAFDFAVESGSLEMIELLFSRNFKREINRIDKDMLLVYAAGLGHINIFRQIKNKNYNLKIGSMLNNLLHVALCGGHFDIISELTYNLKDIDEPNIRNITPLFNWISEVINSKHTLDANQLRIFRHMVNKGANLNKTNCEGETLLHIACLSKEIDFVQLLLENNVDVNIRTNKKEIPLHYASRHSIDYVKLLVEHGSEINASNHLGYTPLCIAAMCGLPDIVTYLIKKNANVQDEFPLPDDALLIQRDFLEMMNKVGIKSDVEPKKCIINMAVMFGNLNCVKVLVEHGAIVNNSVLSEAIVMNHQDIINYILSQNPKLNLDKCLKGMSPLFFAVSVDNVHLMKFLLSHGADINVRDTNECTPLVKASCLGLVNIVNTLMEHATTTGIDIKQVDVALSGAALYGQIDCIKTLIGNGANLDEYGPNIIRIAVENSQDAVADYIISTKTNQEEKMSYINQVLLFAAENNGLRTVELMINKGADLSKHGPSAILFASLSDHIAIIDLLISKGANINGTIRLYNYSAPIHLAASLGNLTAVKCLLRKHADINNARITFDGATPLIVAASKGHINIVEYLIENGAELDIENTNRHTALSVASSEGHLECVMFLIKMGADISKYGPLALWAASENGHVDILDYLISVGANINGTLRGNATPICHAAISNNLNAVQYLIDRGADVNLKTMSMGYTPVMLAAINGNKEMIKYLVKNKAKLDELSETEIGALVLASGTGQLECVQVLIENGANLDKCGPAALWIAIVQGEFSILEYLTSVGANINGLISEKFAPIHYSILNENMELLKYLVGKGARVNTKDFLGKTPLMMAAYIGRLDILEYLVENGAELEEEDMDGNSALTLALAENNMECVHFLVQKQKQIGNSS